MASCCVAYVVVYLACLCILSLQTYQPKYENVALGKPTRQTDTVYGGSSNRPVDGIKESDYFVHPCSHTNSTKNTFWVVDLLCFFPIQNIKITNRRNNYVRLSEFSIYVSNVNPIPALEGDGTLTGELCLNYSGTFPRSGPHSLTCQTPGPLYGRYVYVWKPGNEVLSLCEFEVFVDKAQIDPPNQATLRVIPMTRTPNPPFFVSKMERFSLTNCALLCSVQSTTCPTIAQMDKETKICECIEESDLDEIASSYTHDANWTMMKFTSKGY